MTGSVTGVALEPGVSLNGRLYTKANITKAFERMQARIADTAGSPIVMRTHHGAGDDSTRIVAQVSKVTLDQDCVLRYTADFADTAEAQTIRALATSSDGGKPNLAHVSIYGWWLDDPTTIVTADGLKVETAADLEINAIDFTATPGVIGASASAESSGRRHAIQESNDCEITVSESATAVVTEGVEPVVAPAVEAKRYGDPGYLDGVKRLPLDTIEQAQQAWAFIGVTENQKPYTGPQVKRIKEHVKAAARKLDLAITDEWLIVGAPTTEAVAREYYGDLMVVGDELVTPASFSFSASNGPINVSVSSWCIDPADLEVIAARACAAITLALQGFDPDMDGDIDLPGDPEETAPTSTVTDVTETEAAATATAEDSTPKEPAMAESTTGTPAVEVAAAPEIDYAKLAEAMVTAQTKIAEDAAAKAAADAATAETATAQAAQLREAADGALKDAARELIIEGRLGSPSRKSVALSDQTSAEPTAAELFEKRGELIAAALHTGGAGRS